MFHCSTRRFWEPEFEDRDLNLVGWTKTLTGLSTMTVGSFNCNTTFTDLDDSVIIYNLDRFVAMLDRGDFDLVAVSRVFIANPAWPRFIGSSTVTDLVPFSKTDAADRLF